MCGIVGFIGKVKSLPKLIQGLKKLEYRGYDSAGVAYTDKNGDVAICKRVGRVSNLEDAVNLNEGGNIGIGHTRWATHGGVTEKNSHPHRSNNITIVHNGILENYLELKKLLINEGYVFKSETDTEVACHYIDYVYNKKKSNMIDVLDECMKVFTGSYAISVMVDGNDKELFVMKKDSPLIVACGDDGNYIASDISAYADSTSLYYPLLDNMIGIVSCDNVDIYVNKKKVSVKFEVVDYLKYNNDLQGYEHYMLKEMNEQKDLVKKWYDIYFNNKQINELINVNDFKKVHIVGCGTAYHAGMIGKYLLEYYGDVEVQVFVASEYRYQRLFIDSDTLIIFISQSGETADTLACIKKVKEFGATTLGIVNVENSSIARSVDSVIYTKALSEIAVASTKAYMAQVYVLGMLALRVGIITNRVNISDAESNYHKLDMLIDRALKYDYSTLVNLIKDKEHVFYLGRNIDYITMMEGSLKLKEISYIHSEAMAAGELKHGTISLMSEDSCAIVMVTLEDLASKTISNIKEVKSRGSKVILFIREDMADSLEPECYDELILVPKTIYEIQPMVNIPFLQMLAYEVAKSLGKDIDKPRNLAKSVTVE